MPIFSSPLAKLVPTCLISLLVACGGGGSSSTNQDSASSSTSSLTTNFIACNRSSNDYPCLESRAYTPLDTAGGTAYYRLSMPTGGGNITVTEYNNSDAAVYTTSLQPVIANLQSNTGTFLPEGEYVIALSISGNGAILHVNSTAIADQSLLEPLQVGTYIDADSGYYKLSMPAGGGNIFVGPVLTASAHVYTTDLNDHEINQSADPNNLPSNTSTFLPEGEYVIAVMVGGGVSSISIAF